MEDDPGDVSPDPRGVRPTTRSTTRCTSSRTGSRRSTSCADAARTPEAPRPDLILLDLNLPLRDGREILAEIKADEDLRDDPDRRADDLRGRRGHPRCYDLGANAYVTKPVDFDRFIEVVRKIDDFFVTVVKRSPRFTNAL